MRVFDEALGDIDMSDPQAYADPEVQAALAELDTVFDDEYRAATEAVSQYVAENCDPGVG